jgi:hypothetical protein
MIEPLENPNAAPVISKHHYENIFNMYREDGYSFYNLLQHIVLPKEIDPVICDEKPVQPGMPYSVLSHRIYGTMHLWWLICVVNNIYDPTKLTQPGDILRIVKPEFVGKILGQIESQLPK